MTQLPNTTLRLVFAAGLVLAMQSAAMAAVDARVLVQVWDPTTPEKQGLQVRNEPNLVSDQIQKAWTQARPKICAALLGEISKPGFAAGLSLRDIKCLLDQRADFTVANSGPSALAVSLAVGGAVEATSTSPDPLGSWADPRFSLAVRARAYLSRARTATLLGRRCWRARSCCPNAEYSLQQPCGPRAFADESVARLTRVAAANATGGQ